LPDAIWLKLEQEREIPLQPAQGDLEDLPTAGAPASATAPSTTQRRPRAGPPGAPIQLIEAFNLVRSIRVSLR